MSDVESATAHYAETAPELGARFVDDIDSVVERIAMFPKGSPPVEGFTALRRARMRRFPYGIFYQETTAGEVLVVRILHSRRRHQDALES